MIFTPQRKVNGWPLDRARILSALAKLPSTVDTALAARRAVLRAQLDVGCG